MRFQATAGSGWTLARALFLGCVICGSGSVVRGDDTTADTGPVVVHRDDFENDLSQWVVEQAEGGSVRLADGKLVIEDAAGCTVWFRHRLEGPVAIEFEATLIDEGGKYDRVSDLNCFWMAVDPRHPDDLFANRGRGGVFANYHGLRLYYVGYGANGNTTTRFRRYPGDGTRPCLPEHDLDDRKFMNVANRSVAVRIVSDGESVRFLRDGEVVFDVVDEAPFRRGWFGFRTVKNHMTIDRFRVHRLPARTGKAEDRAVRPAP